MATDHSPQQPEDDKLLLAQQTIALLQRELLQAHERLSDQGAAHQRLQQRAQQLEAWVREYEGAAAQQGMMQVGAVAGSVEVEHQATCGWLRSSKTGRGGRTGWAE